MHPSSKHTRAFTFIELLVTMVLVAILAGLAYPAYTSVMERARKTQAKNDLTQIVTAVNAYYTEYGKYPVVTDDTPLTDNFDLFFTLRAVAMGANGSDVLNPRKIVFITPPDAQDLTLPKSGIAAQDVTAIVGGVPTVVISAGSFVDPWGTPYRVAIDGTYDNQIANPYTTNTGAGTSPLHIGVISWSAGKDGKAPDNGGTQTFTVSNDVISWQ
jgi:prepilin-type N-terminal cleavage/methylation domain-containing protein